MSIKIALGGNPNSGKTTLFNALTGSNQYVGNWPGVTVEKKEGKIKGHKDVLLVDLPGIYSLSPYTLEEVITRNYMNEEKPDAIINIIDGSNLERNLYLTTQIVELGIPTIVAINMMDIIRKNGDRLDVNALGKQVGCEVVEICALTGEGIERLADKAVKLAKSKTVTIPRHSFSGSVEHALAHIEEEILHDLPDEKQRWYAIKLFERDAKIIEKLELDKNKIEHIELDIKRCEEELDDDSESIITNERYNYITSIIGLCYERNEKRGRSVTDKIDSIVTDKFLALPIFAIVMVLIYYISVTSVGGIVTDWANDGVFGDGWHLAGIGDKEYSQKADEYGEIKGTVSAFQKKSALAAEIFEKEALRRGMAKETITPQGSEIEVYADKAKKSAARGAENVMVENENAGMFGDTVKNKEIVFDVDYKTYVMAKAVSEAEKAESQTKDGEATPETEKEAIEKWAKVERIKGNFDLEAYVPGEVGKVDEDKPVDFESFKRAKTQLENMQEPDPKDYGIWITGIPIALDGWLKSVNVADWLHSLIINGIVAGVGAVLGFVPQMFVLFFFLAILESCGYMARVAFIMDKLFRSFGLSGKSFIPILIGTGCGIPGIMASRTIESERDRKMTIVTTTFIPCGAKLPIIALIAGAMFGGAWWVSPSAYFIGITAIITSGIILKKTKLFAGNPSPFVMELPPYHLPVAKNVFLSMWERGWSFVKKAGTFVLLATVIIWFTSGYGWKDGVFGAVSSMDDGILAGIGRFTSPVFEPLGWGTWQGAVAAISGLTAKEVIVGMFGVLYGGFDEVAENGWQVWANLRAAFTPLSAYSFLVFNLLCAPCFAAMGAIRREMNNARWTAFAILYQTIFAYAAALVIYQTGTFIMTGVFKVWTAIAIFVALVFCYLLFRPNKNKAYTRRREEKTT